MVTCAPVKSLLPGHRCQTGSGYRTSPANCNDPIRGSGPGEIVFRHMSVVQRDSTGLSASLLVRLGIATSASLTGSMLVVLFWLLIVVIGDLFRRLDISGWGKAIWVIALIVFPYLAVFAYVIYVKLVAAAHGIGRHAGQRSCGGRLSHQDHYHVPDHRKTCSLNPDESPHFQMAP